MAAAIAAGIEDGSITGTVDARAAAERLTALVDGLSARWLAGLDRARAGARAARRRDRHANWRNASRVRETL